jgi:hypothetical protein
MGICPAFLALSELKDHRKGLITVSSGEPSGRTKAAVIAGIFAVIAACIAGVFLLAATLIEQGFVVIGPGVQVGNPKVEQPTHSVQETVPQPSLTALPVIVQSTNTPVPPTATRVPPAAVPSNGLSSCQAFQGGETRQVAPGTFVVGDIVVDDVVQYDRNQQEATYGYPEGTIAFLERETSVTAPWGAGCYRGDIDQLNEVIQGEFAHGCETGCVAVRVVIVRTNGQQEVQ